MIHYVGLDVSQKMTAICLVDSSGRRVWRGQCTTGPEQASAPSGSMAERTSGSAWRLVQ
jgi:hypothetical protein